MTIQRLPLLLAALLPLCARAHTTATSGSAAHHAEHGLMTIGYLVAAALVAAGLFQWLRRAQSK